MEKKDKGLSDKSQTNQKLLFRIIFCDDIFDSLRVTKFE